MANLNVEPGTSSYDELIGDVERGVLMESNVSWSIDDSRNKFQFGCEWGQLIERGELRGVVKNPNYRGISSQFWKSLTAVGDASTREVLGTPHCGKGEPNQVVRVGHATPACVFAAVDVFGGASWQRCRAHFMSNLLTRLEKRGLIARENDKDDRRVTHVRLTEAGVGIATEAMAVQSGTENDLCRGLDDAERKALISALAKLLDAALDV